LRASLESEDVLQSVALEAFKALPRFRPHGPGSLRHYLHKMVVNKIRDRADYFSAQKRAGTVPLSDEELERLPGHGGQVPEYYDGARFEELERNLERLPPEMERVLILRRVDGLSSKETARVLGKSDDAVRKLYSRAIARLTLMMDETSD